MDLDPIGAIEDWFVGFVDDMVRIPFDFFSSVMS